MIEPNSENKKNNVSVSLFIYEAANHFAKKLGLSLTEL